MYSPEQTPHAELSGNNVVLVSETQPLTAGLLYQRVALYHLKVFLLSSVLSVMNCMEKETNGRCNETGASWKVTPR